MRIILQGKRRRKRRGRRRDNLKKTEEGSRKCEEENDDERERDRRGKEIVLRKWRWRTRLKLNKDCVHYFTLHSDGKNAGGNLNLGERKEQQQKKQAGGGGSNNRKRKEGLPRKLFLLLFSQVSTSVGLIFPLTGLPFLLWTAHYALLST